MTLETWKAKHQKSKAYAHFDSKVSLDQVWKYISNSQQVASHSFYPFIHFSKKADRFSKPKGDAGTIVEKTRDLYYSAHIDRYIYQYYGYLLNQKYNERTKEGHFHDSAIAYRDNFDGKCSIDFAKRAFDFIRKTAPCYIIIGDFTKFFDRLEHRYLKKMLCSLLKVKQLPDDYYAVYKNITRFSLWELENLLAFHGLENNHSGYKKLNKLTKVLTPEEFKSKKAEQIKQPTKKQGYGIPQGSAISAVFSNIYMLDTDEKISSFVQQNNGLYMRYSDDFIVVLPKTTEDQFKIGLSKLLEYISGTPNLELQPEKTKIYLFEGGLLVNKNSTFLKNVIDSADLLNYLGFSFNGQVVTIRDKTIAKYYYRMYRKAKAIVKSGGITKKGNRITGKNLYIKYSKKGAYPTKNVQKTSAKKYRGNFLTYVSRAKKIFGDNEAIERSTKYHMDKIRKQLKKLEADFSHDIKRDPTPEKGKQNHAGPG